MKARTRPSIAMASASAVFGATISQRVSDPVGPAGEPGSSAPSLASVARRLKERVLFIGRCMTSTPWTKGSERVGQSLASTQ